MPRDASAGSLLLLGLVALVTISIVAYTQIATPVVRDAIEDMGADVPASSSLALAVSSPAIAVPGALVFLTLLVIKEWYVKNKMVCLLVNNVVLVVILAAFAFYRDATAYPLLLLIQQLSG